jgi:adenosylcobinamide-phosphate synthase
MSVPLSALAAAIEWRFGYPERLTAAIGHPVMWIGRLISLLDATLNREADGGEARRKNGAIALAIIVGVPLVAGWIIESNLALFPLGAILVAVVASSLIAQQSLDRHVADVADALDLGLEEGREAVSLIVGRDPESLDEAGVSRAAIESLAENFSDGVVAPVFWLAILGLAGGAAYKAANTADSMIGHRTPRHEDFGRAAARFDDLINLPASRLSALLLVAAAYLVPGASAGAAWEAVQRDAGRHRSPNAGWPEAAMAGALGLALAGPRSYGGKLVDDAVMGKGGRREATANDIRRALQLYRVADLILIGGLAVIALLFTLQD